MGLIDDHAYHCDRCGKPIDTNSPIDLCPDCATALGIDGDGDSE